MSDYLPLPPSISRSQSKNQHAPKAREGARVGGTRVRTWRKPGRNDACPCGAHRTREDVLDACAAGGGHREIRTVAVDGKLVVRTRFELLVAALDHRVLSGLPDGLPRKFKHCHGSERALVGGAA